MENQIKCLNVMLKLAIDQKFRNAMEIVATKKTGPGIGTEKQVEAGLVASMQMAMCILREKIYAEAALIDPEFATRWDEPTWPGAGKQESFSA